MSLETIPSFYYGFNITNENNAIDFSEGGGELLAAIPIGRYSLTEIVQAIEEVMTDAGSLEYSVSLDRLTRVITISASGTFELLAASGPRVGTGVWSLIGFEEADFVGSDSYAGSTGAGSSYVPQFLLQDFVDSENMRKVVDGVTHESASGRNIETVTFGKIPFTEFNITLATDIDQGSASPIRGNPNGVSGLRDFIRFASTKGKIEFNKDKDSPNTFDILRLESTQDDQRGLDERLFELTDRGLTGYFETGILRFRVVG